MTHPARSVLMPYAIYSENTTQEKYRHTECLIPCHPTTFFVYTLPLLALPADVTTGWVAELCPHTPSLPPYLTCSAELAVTSQQGMRMFSQDPEWFGPL